jgi:hypothetical protein
MQNPTTADQAESSVIPTESGMAVDEIGNEAVVPTNTKRAPATGQENEDHPGKSLPMMTVDRARVAGLPRQLLGYREEPNSRHDTPRNNANDARKPAPIKRLVLHSKMTQLACPTMTTIANGPRVCIPLANPCRREPRSKILLVRVT